MAMGVLVSGNAIAAAATTNAVEKLANSDCLDCHTDPSNTRIVNGQKVPLPVFPTNSFARSVHAMLDCTDCHTGVKELVHDANLPPPDCSGCHDKEAKDYATSIHGMSHAMGASGAAQCWDCHGSHDILPVKDPDVAGVQNEPAVRPARSATATRISPRNTRSKFPRPRRNTWTASTATRC